MINHQRSSYAAQSPMKVAIPVFDERISPLFDVARALVVVNIEAGREVWRERISLDDSGLVMRARQLGEQGIDVLICGAISRLLEEMLESAGVAVISQMCGPVEEVLSAFLTGELTYTAFRMPGHRGEYRHISSRATTSRESFPDMETIMPPWWSRDEEEYS